MRLSFSLQRHYHAIPFVIQGALYMTVAAFCFAAMNVAVREASATLPPLEIAFFRNFFALIFIAPWLLKGGIAGLTTRRFPLHSLRAVFGIAAMSLWFTAVTLMPLPEVVALNFSLPLFVIAGAALLLGERVGPRRIAATVVGFCGMLVILRPGFMELTWIASLPILAAVFMAGSVLMVKRLSDTESPTAMVFYMNLLMTPLSLVPALFDWHWPDPEVWGLLAFLGLLAMLAHLALAIAYSKADASAIMPFDYTRLPFVAVLAYLYYGEVADLWTWVGAAIIAGSAIYIAHREAKVAGRQNKPKAAEAPHGP